MVFNIHFAQLFFKLHLCKQTLYSVSFKINSVLKNTCPEMNVIWRTLNFDKHHRRSVPLSRNLNHLS